MSLLLENLALEKTLWPRALGPHRCRLALPRTRRGACTGSLAGMIWGWSADGVAEKEAKELNLNLKDCRLQLTLELPPHYPRATEKN
jgi:hypothetical protein